MRPYLVMYDHNYLFIVKSDVRLKYMSASGLIHIRPTDLASDLTICDHNYLVMHDSDQVFLLGEHLINPLRACIEPSARALPPNTPLAVRIRLC